MEVDNGEKVRIAHLEEHQRVLEEATKLQNDLLIKIDARLDRLEEINAIERATRSKFNERIGRWVERVLWLAATMVAAAWEQLLKLKGGN